MSVTTKKVRERGYDFPFYRAHCSRCGWVVGGGPFANKRFAIASARSHKRGYRH